MKIKSNGFVIGTSEKLRVGSPYVFFRAKLRVRQQVVENAVTLKRLKVETCRLELR